MNNVNLLGRLGQDPQTTNGVCKISVATNDGTKDKPKTNWHNVVSFGKTAEILQNYLKKGDQIAINGRVDYNKHEDKTYTSIIVNSFTFVGSAKQEDLPY
jgi:single-strand DNA-binding protein